MLLKRIISLWLLMLVIILFVYVDTAYAAITEQVATSIALDAIKSQYTLTEDDLAEYVLGEAMYQESPESDGNEWDEWYISFVGTLEHSRYSNNTYTVYLAPDGVVKRIIPPTIHNPINVDFRNLIYERGMFVTWSIEEKYEFAKTFSRKLDEWNAQVHSSQESEVFKIIIHLASIDYQLPKCNDIDFETAKKDAYNALIEQEGWVDFSKFDNVCSSFLVLPQNKTIWRVFFIPVVRRDTDCGYRVDVDSKTGEAIEVLHQYVNDSDWASEYE